MRSTSDSTRFNNAKLDKIIKLALDKKAQELHPQCEALGVRGVKRESQRLIRLAQA